MLAFLASFILLPSTKAVNNFYYVFLALPALVLIVRRKAAWPEATLLIGLWGGLFGWLLVSGTIFGDGRFFRHLLYTFLFCAIVVLWVEKEKFERNSLFRCFFWSLILYVVASASYLWITGRLGVGVRVTDLPARLEGPILTSMLIVSSFALLTPEWLRSRCWIEMVMAVFAILFCVGFVLQSRSGLVGFTAVLIMVAGALFWRNGWRMRAIIMVVSMLALFSGAWVYEHSNVAAGLVARADSGRFELWQAYLRQWVDCGLLFGCGPSFAGEIYIHGGVLIYHPHNVFLAMGFYHGFPALLLFSAAMLLTIWYAWKQQNPWGCYLAVALLMLNFDGSRVVDNPREVWLLVLLPAMLIAANQEVPVTWSKRLGLGFRGENGRGTKSHPTAA